jgi:hypothetical protein
VLLEFESQPAIVILGSWAPQVAQDQGYGDPQIVHLPIATYYDIPYISLKRLIFNHYTRFPQSTVKTFWLRDQLHPNARGHVSYILNSQWLTLAASPRRPAHCLL